MGKIIDGESLAKPVREEAARKAKAIEEKRGSPPLLAIVSSGKDPGSEAYLKQKLSACRKTGIAPRVERLPPDASENACRKLLTNLSTDETVDGVIIDLPLPPGIAPQKIIQRLNPEKDVEGITPDNFGRLFETKSMAEIEASLVFIPCTAHALIRLLLSTGVTVQGAEAVVVGRSNIVGKPVAHLLTCLNATVTLCHTGTREIASHIRRADIVVSATTRPRWIEGEMIRGGAVVLDAGIHFQNGKLCGDVAFESVLPKASFVTPVPGGVGPVTIATLLSNVTLAAERR